jgi:hypothetical protein
MISITLRCTAPGWVGGVVGCVVLVDVVVVGVVEAGAVGACSVGVATGWLGVVPLWSVVEVVWLDVSEEVVVAVGFVDENHWLNAVNNFNKNSSNVPKVYL